MATNNGSGARSEIVVRYRECQRNHAAPVMRYAVDGCGDFVAAGENGSPEALICEACGCHRSFHRREEVVVPARRRTIPRLRFVRRIPLPSLPPPPPPPPPPSPPSPQQPTLPQSEPPAAAPRNVRRAPTNPPPEEVRTEPLDGGEIEEEVGTKKKGRTKLRKEQKERLRAFAEKLGWRPQRHDMEEIRKFCLDNEITPQIFKNWINNNRHRMETGEPSSTRKTGT